MVHILHEWPWGHVKVFGRKSSGTDDLGEMPEVRRGRILARIPWEIVHVRYVGKWVLLLLNSFIMITYLYYIKFHITLKSSTEYFMYLLIHLNIYGNILGKCRLLLCHHRKFCTGNTKTQPYMKCSKEMSWNELSRLNAWHDSSFNGQTGLKNVFWYAFRLRN